MVSSMEYRGTTCYTMVFSTSCTGISALAPGAPPLSPSSPNLVSAGLLLLRFSHSSLFSVFYPCLNFLSQRCHQLHCWALASSRSVLELAGPGVQPCSAPCLLVQVGPHAGPGAEQGTRQLWLWEGGTSYGGKQGCPLPSVVLQWH